MNFQRLAKMEKQFKLSPKDYNALLKNLELINIYLKECSSKLFVERNTIKNPVFKVTDSYSVNKQVDSFYEIFHSYKISAKDNKTTILEIKCTFGVLLESKEELTEDFFEIYNKISLPVNTWPYLREFANSTTARMNIPPLTLHLLKR